MVVAKLWLPAVSSEDRGVVDVAEIVEGGWRGGGGRIWVLSATGLEAIGWERMDG